MTRITYDGAWIVPDTPDVGYIIGDGIGTDVTPAAMKVLNAAVEKAYDGKRKILWEEILAGEKAQEATAELLPQASLDKVKELRVVLKGPLATPVGSGHRSLNVTLRQLFDLYSCVRPVKYMIGLPAPVREPQKVDVVIFRENTEDVYAGIEWPSDSEDADDIIDLVKARGKTIKEHSGIGIKPISPHGSKRLVRAAIEYAIKNDRKSVTLVHKGNIMKFTEGAFRDWGYEVAKEYGEKVAREGEESPGQIVIKDRIADAMFQQLLLRPDEYDVIATMNLNGDYLSDAAAAQIGGLGMAPGANIGDGIAIFEATHGTAPKYVGQDKVNPSSVLLSGVMMLELFGWDEAKELILDALERTIIKKTVTYDLHRQMNGATLLKCSEFADAIIENMN